MMVTATATLSLTGPHALQGRQAARGLELWASADQIQLQIVDNAGSATTASDAYRRWLGGQVDLLLGPYGSGLVRQVGAHRLPTGSLALEPRRFRRRLDPSSFCWAGPMFLTPLSIAIGDVIERDGFWWADVTPE